MGFLKFHPSFSGKRDSGKNLKKVLALVLAFACAFTMFAGAAFTDSADIKVDTEVVDTLVSLGVVNGYDDGSFKPNGTVTRAEMAKMIYVLRTGNSDASAYNDDKTSFTDIGSHWARGYIKYCQSLGIIAGKSATKFCPNDKVTAQEAAKMLLVTLGYDATKAGLTGANWASKTNALADENGLLEDVNTSFTSACPRQYAAQLIYNAIFAPTVVWRDDAYTNKTLIGDEDLPTVGEKFMGLKNPKGILTSVKYDDNDKTYTTVIDRVGADDLSFDATADYSALMGQQVKALYKEGKNGDDDTLYGIYATDKNKTVTTLVDDIDAYDGGFKVNGKEYDFAATVKFVAPNGKKLDRVTKYSDLAAYHTVTFVDNNNDKKYEYAVCDPFTVAKVDSLTAKKAYFVDTLDDSATSVDRDDLDAYDKIAEDDYVILTNKDYSVSGNTVAVKADEVSGKVAGTKADGSIKVDGNWYKKADADVDAPDSGDTLKYAVVKNGFYFDSDCKNGSTDKLALVLKAADASDFDGDYFDAKLLLSDGTTKTTKAYVKGRDRNNKVTKTQPLPGTLYTYTTNNTGYVLEKIANGDDIGMDTAAITGATYDPVSNKVTKGGSSTRLAADAKVFVKYETNKGKVVTGAAADKWASVVGNYTVTVAYTDTTVKVMVVDQNTSSNPSISDDSLYGVILSEPYKDKNADDEDIVVIDKFLTENGIVTNLKIDTDEFAMSDLKKNMLVSYQMDGEDYVKFDTVADGATAAVGAITDVDGDYVTVLTTAGTKVELKVDKDDSHILYVDTDAEDAASGSIKKATKKDADNYYANIMVIYKTVAENDESRIIWGAAIDSANQLQDADGNDVLVTIR